MTSTLYFYKLPINLLDKNFILENLETYLATLTPVTKSNFQFQRFDMEKTIKVNISQDYQSYNGLTRYNYLKITQLNSNNTTAIYYYFIKKARQISESTIAFDLVMDTLNTFKYKTTFESGQDYTLSDKSLITREHKDRITSFVSNQVGSALYLQSQINLNEYYLLDVSSWSNGTDILRQCGGFGIPLIGHANIEFMLIINDKQYIHFSSISGFKYTKTADNQVSITTLDGNGGSVDTYNFGVVFDKLYFRVIKWGNTSYINSFLAYVNPYKCYAFYQRIIDKYQEGIEAITFKQNEKELWESGSYHDDWYICYSSANAVVDSPSDTQPLYVNPVQVDFLSDGGYSISTQSASVVRIYPGNIPQYSNYEEWLFIDLTKLEAGGYVVINGVQYDSTGFTHGGITYTSLSIQKKNNNDLEFARVCPAKVTSIIITTNVSYIDFYGLNSCDLYKGLNNAITGGKVQDFYIGSGSSTITGTSDPFEDFDLTDPKLIKIICCPYAPRDDLKDVGVEPLTSELVWNANLNCLELKKAQINGFNRTLIFGEVESPLNGTCLQLSQLSESSEQINMKRYSRDIQFESKLYHSDYHIPKFVYDSFAFMFRLEDVDINNYVEEEFYKQFEVQYVISGNVQSKFMFKFNQYVCDRELEDYHDVLLVDRNNEKAIFNNAYINYIRSGGYRYDTKNADMQKMMNGITIPLAGLASGAGIGAMLGASSAPGPLKIAGAVAGAVIGMATKTISAIHSAQQNDRQIAQKLLSASQQSTNVSTSEDIDILKAYSNNKAKLCFYEVSSYLKNALWDLFHYFGYRCNEYKIPQTNTRCNFNFIQGDIVLKDFTFNDDVARDIISKWADGVTFMHYDNSLGYDFNQEYENFETSLL